MMDKALKQSNRSALYALVMAVMLFIGMMFSSAIPVAQADMRVGDTQMTGYTPSDMIEVGDDDGVPTEEKLARLPTKLEAAIVAFVRILLPFMAVGAVCIIIYNVIANFFRKDDDKVPMSRVLKDIIVGFFFVLFAWIIVELILYVELGGQAFIEEYLL